MSIIVNEKTPVIVQGFTGRMGTFHAEEMLKYDIIVFNGGHVEDGIIYDLPDPGEEPGEEGVGEEGVWGRGKLTS